MKYEKLKVEEDVKLRDKLGWPPNLKATNHTSIRVDEETIIF